MHFGPPPTESFPPGLPRTDCIWLDTVDSTNRYLFRLLGHSPRPEEGLVVAARHQTQGRGQQQATWHTSPGANLTASWLLYPDFLTPSGLFYLVKAVTLGVAQAVGALVEGRAAVQVKWPNDILIDGRKVAGILIENILVGTRVETSVVGVGLNVNETAFPPSLQSAAVSLRQVVGHPLSVRTVLGVVAEKLQHHYNRLRQDHPQAYDRQYLQSLYRYQEWAQYEAHAELFEGMIVGVTADGRLALQRAGELRYYHPKEVRYR